MSIFHRQKPTREKPQEKPAKIKKPKGDLLFSIADSGLRLTAYESPDPKACLAAFDRYTGRFCHTVNIEVPGNDISFDALEKAVLSILSVPVKSRIRMCLCLPSQGQCFYLKDSRYNSGNIADAEPFVMLTADPEVDELQASNRKCLYTSGGGLLSVTYANRFSFPQEILDDPSKELEGYVLPKPSTYLPFNVCEKELTLSVSGKDNYDGWLVAYDRSTGTYCCTERIFVFENRILFSDLEAFARILPTAEKTGQFKICLFAPYQNVCMYLQKELIGNEVSLKNIYPLILSEDTKVPGLISQCIYIARNRVLSINLASKVIRPKAILSITPDALENNTAVNLNRFIPRELSDKLYFGLYNSSSKETSVFAAREGCTDMAAISAMLSYSTKNEGDSIYLCAVLPTPSDSCRYIELVPSVENPDEPFFLGSKLDALVTTPFKISDTMVITLCRTSRGRLHVIQLPSDILDMYHNDLLEFKTSNPEDASIIELFDPDRTLLSTDIFFDYIHNAARALRRDRRDISEKYRLRKRALYNIALMIQAGAESRNPFDTDTTGETDIDRWHVLHDFLTEIDDEVITSSTFSRYTKMLLMAEKYDNQLVKEEYINNIMYTFGGTSLFTAGSLLIYIDIVEISDQHIKIEGCLRYPGALVGEGLQLTTYVNRKIAAYSEVERYADKYIYGIPYTIDKGFALEVPLTQDTCTIEFGIKSHGFVSPCRNVNYSETSVVSNKLKNNYYIKDNFVIKGAARQLICSPCTEADRASFEQNLQEEIRTAFAERADTIICLRNYYFDHIRKNNEKKRWVFIDRPDRADDNAEAMFKFMVNKNSPDIEPIFILDENAPMFDELSKAGTVYSFGSEEHLKAVLTSEFIISSQFSPATMNPFNDDYDCFRDIVRTKKFVFLQHGVIHNHHTPIFGRYGRNFCGFVVSGFKEYEYIKSDYFHYTEKEVWLTGLPRFDYLYENDQRILTIMPTWRRDLTVREYNDEEGTRVWRVKDDFTESEYYNFYNGLINNEQLLKAARDNGFKIMFMPHVQFLKQSHLFENANPDIVSICDYDVRYRDIFAMSSLILTDYTSAVFDFAYMRKPIVYCHFDKEAFYKNHTVKKGYFDHERDGFGEVTYNLPDTVSVLISYIKNGCQMKDVYKKRADAFFKYTDHNCCQRVYEKILEARDQQPSLQLD